MWVLLVFVFVSATVIFEGDVIATTLKGAHLSAATVNITGTATEAHHVPSVSAAKGHFLMGPLVYLHLIRLTPQTITAGATHAIHSWSTIENNFGFTLPTATNQGVTVPFAGVYIVYFQSIVSLEYFMTINDNTPTSSSTKYAVLSLEEESAVATFTVQNAGDIVYIWVYNAGGGNTNICDATTSDIKACHLTMTRIGY